MENYFRFILAIFIGVYATFSCKDVPDKNTRTTGGEIPEKSTENPALKPDKTENSKKTSVVKKIAPETKTSIPEISSEEAVEILYPEKKDAEIRKQLSKECSGNNKEKIICLLKNLYKKDKKALELAISFFNRSGNIAGRHGHETMEGGWRGIVKIVPALPVGNHRRHLRDVTASFEEYDDFLKWLSKSAKKPVKFRISHIAFKFFKTPGKRTPSASAWKWTINYNLFGSLLLNIEGIRETLYHELFHLNDAQHKNWSEKQLMKTYNSILEKCKKYMVKGHRQGEKYQKCLRPYSPYKTTVLKDNVFYAFHRDSDVGEYGAELAVRFYVEHRAIMKKLSIGEQKKILGSSAPGHFKCGPKENALAWNLLRDEFFGGVDHTPPCKTPVD
ncbi:hypothetical protein KKF34_15930 [Myxococcota bacterium]|nr:hypothetical protein [Myxococcota bacterium]MBU1380434.1 hypothetical protein [Myxococcota bacterium]MBU1498366.1 hypothetical protein [Myxococcota bacterium]